MLLPFEWTVLTVEDAKLIIEFIEKSTATKGLSKNYDKMQKAGVMEIHGKLSEFVDMNIHYHNELKNLDTFDFQKKDYD